MKSDTFDAAGAAERLSAAIEARGNLLRDAAAGLPVTPQEFRATEEAVRLAEQDATLASELVKFQAAERDRAEIAAFQATADALAEEMATRAEEHLAAASELDAAMEVARAAAGRFDHARQAMELTDRACHAHNALLDTEAHTNAILSAQHRSVWPKARTPLGSPQRFGTRIRPELVSTSNAPRLPATGEHDVVLRDTAEQLAQAAQSSLPKPLPAAA